jgi:hypothetical protein
VIPKLIAKLQHGRMDECAEELAETVMIMIAMIEDLYEDLQALQITLAEHGYPFDPEDIH